MAHAYLAYCVVLTSLN